MIITASFMALSCTQDNFDLMFVYKHLEFLFGVSDSWAGLFFFFFPLFFNCHLVIFQSLSHVQLFVTPCTAAHQSSWPSLSPGVCANHVHWVSDAIQPSHPLSSPSPLAFSLSQHQGLFQMSQLLASSGQSFEALASVQYSNEYSVAILAILKCIVQCH